ncbi:MAG: hypothetical protein WC819_01045 [Parcubacteria group bacterium]|jgi:hypothetical protein
MNDVKKIFVVCSGEGCGNVLGCFDKYGINRICIVDCGKQTPHGKEQFFQCTDTKDHVEQGDLSGYKIELDEKGSCDLCPTSATAKLDLEPVAYMSS